MVLLPQTTIAGAVANQLGRAIAIPTDIQALIVEAAFAYGSGGTTAKAWVQTRVKGGTWRDIMCFAFTTAALTKWQAVRSAIALAPNIAASDAALADNTILDGLIGDELRVKYTTTGTYAGVTHLTLRATLRRVA
jgi:hypothetical protein